MTQPKPLKLIEPKCFTLDKFKSKKFIYNEEYQRSEVWKSPRKQKLIESILNNYPIGTLIFRELIKDKKFEVIDGQQRLRTIGEFIRKDCKWKTSKYCLIAPSMSLNDIKKNNELKRTFEGYEVWYILIPGDDEQICDIFVRMQEGVRTNTAEKLNAMGGKMRNLIFNLSKLGFFEKTSVSKYRFGYRDIMSNVCLLELNFLNKMNSLDKLHIEFPDLRFGKLKAMYKEYKELTPSFLEKNISRTFNFLDLCFGEKSEIKDAKFIENKGDFLQMYLLASIISKNYIISQLVIKKFALFFMNFLVESINQDISDIENVNEDLRKNPCKFYAFLRSKGQTKVNLKRKFQVLSEELFKTLKDAESSLILKDQKKDFEYCQKIYVYYKKDNQTCQKCNKHIELDEASFHHKKFRSSGGPTTIENCQLLCKKCHIYLHKETGKDNTEINID